jgi:hypothetical protein
MEKVVIILIWAIVVWSESFAQAGLKYFGDPNCQSYQPAMTLIKGDIVENQCDTAFLVNKMRYDLYEKARNTILKMDFKSFNQLLKSYDQSLMMAYKSYDSLNLKYSQLETVFVQTVNENRQMLKTADQNLANASTTLENTRKQLDEIIVAMKKDQKKRIWRGAGFFGIGLGTGILAGLLIN